MFTFITKCLTATCSKRISKITLFLFFLFASTQLIAQDYDAKDLDSLKKAAYKSTEKNKVDCYIWVSIIYGKLNLDSSYYYAKTALKIAEKNNYEFGIARSLGILSGFFFNLSDYYNSLKYGIEALALFRKLGDKKRERVVLNNIGVVYLSMGLLEKACDYHFKSLKICEEMKDTLGLASTYYSMANIYRKLNMVEKAIGLNKMALRLFNIKKNLDYIPSILNNLSSEYSELNRFDSARYYQIEALKFAKLNNDLSMLAKITDNIGREFSIAGNYDSAITYHHKAIAIYNELRTKDLSSPFLSLSDSYMDMKNLDSAYNYLEKASKIIKKSENYSDISDLYLLYVKYYRLTKNPNMELEYFKLHSQIKDSVISEKARNRLIDYQIDYEIEKVKAENEIQTLKNRNQRNIFIILSVLILILTIAIYSRYLLKKKNNRLLSEKNIELENVNKIKDKFFGIVAHDLKSQLKAFQYILQVLKDDYKQISDESKHKLILRIDSAANTLYEVLENLLIWSTSQIKGINFEPKEINLNELSNQVLNELKLTAERKTVSLRNKIPLDISVLADENMVRNIIRNLVNNSIKFSDENTEVTITSIKKNDKIEVSIIDQGIGISDTDKEKLFRLDVDHKQIGSQKEKGTGLGLVISKTFIEKMKGNIWISNNVERGCIFSFSLPIYTR